MRPLLAVLLALAVAPAALAQGREKRLQNRHEAEGLIHQIIGGSGGALQQAVSRLQYLGEQDFATQMLQREARSADERIRRNVSFALNHLATPRTEPLLVGFAQDEDAVVRQNGAQGLGRIHSRNVNALRPLLTDRTAAVRRAAAEALGAGRNPKAGKPLIAAAHAEQDLEVRAVMLTAAGASGDRAQVKPLQAYLKSSSEATRLGAARGLCQLGDKAGFAFAQRLLGSKDRYERQQGLSLFEGSPAKAAKPVLEPLLQDPDRGIGATAARILYQGGDVRMLDWLVLASYQSKGSEKMAFEAELETLQLADDVRRKILSRAGVP